jgi:hypothetical protein
MTFSDACGAPEGMDRIALRILVAERDTFWPTMMTEVVVLLRRTVGVIGAFSGGFGGVVGSVTVSRTFCPA